ncbi:MAG: ATP-dependent RNA helicase [Chloroflexi bacterium]|nr:ATP-dependent RNA helicase [Chloroflexota bacterium]
MQRDLPVWDLHDRLQATWQATNRLVLVAPTGSGKTTQVCQMILQAGRNNGKQIVVLQPRRVAARTVARRVAEEMRAELGKEVGYQVRFEDIIAPETRIAFVTEGILLRWLQDQPTLSHAGAILFDEFHERNLLSDIGLALIKELQEQSRPDLLLAVMSATLETAPVATYLGDCPVLQSQGRTYPVELRYQTWADDRPVWELATEHITQIIKTTSTGDILVFMPGAYEIQNTIDEIRRARIVDPKDREDLLVIPLHGELSPHDQDRAFIPTAYRRVIVSTNVAETSVTIPGIRFVVDSGQARIARYDPERGISTLHVEPISQASADQRAGRAGRTGPGICYRLWTQAEHAQRPAHNTPEIQRTDLSEVVLLLHSFGVSDAEHFHFLDQPDVERIHHAEALLETLGAITPAPHTITATGRRMLRLPVHPRYARMLIEAEKYGCVPEMALFAALVGGRDLLTRLNREDRITRRNRESLVRNHESDFYLLAASFAHAVKHQFDYKTCYSFGINPHVAKEVAQTYRQILELVGQTDSMSYNPSYNEAIQKCHLAGFIDQFAVRQGGGEDFELTHGRHATLMQESVVNRSPLVVVSAIREITTRQQEKLTLIGIASAVKAEWLRELDPPDLSEQVEHVYDRLHRCVVAAQVLRYGNLVMGGTPLDEIDPAAAAQVLAHEFVRNPHPPSVPRWERELKPWLLRVAALRARTPELALPVFDDEQIAQGLAQAWHGTSSFKAAAGRPLLPTFQAMLTPTQRAAVERDTTTE